MIDQAGLIARHTFICGLAILHNFCVTGANEEQLAALVITATGTASQTIPGKLTKGDLGLPAAKPGHRQMYNDILLQ